MALGALRSSAGVRQLIDLRARLDALQVQLATGKKAQDYAGLGGGRSAALDARAKLARLGDFEAGIAQITVRMRIAQNAFDRMHTIAAEQRSASLEQGFTPVDGKQSAQQKQALAYLEEIVGLFNQEVGGRRLFSGRAADQDASVSADAIINGTAGKAGLRDVVVERAAADGTTGQGRLDASAAGALVSLVKDSGVTDRLGFVVAAAGSTSAGIAATRTAGPPASATFNVVAQPAEGEAVLLTLGMTDGTSLDLRLEATAGAPGTGRFQIGATPADTAANLAAALDAALASRASERLVGASALAAADGFFDIDDTRQPLRVNGAGTDVVQDTTGGTVRWYTGDGAADDARGTAAARIDTSVSVGYGMRANEAGFRKLLAGLAAFAAKDFDPSAPSTAAAYRDMSLAVREKLGDSGGQSVRTIQSEMVVVQQSLKAASERHVSAKAVLGDLLGSVEDVSKEQVATQILELKVRLEASYQTTSIISQMSLVNFLR
jgi:flagellin-like hook-associated protein FlgL